MKPKPPTKIPPLIIANGMPILGHDSPPEHFALAVKLGLGHSDKIRRRWQRRAEKLFADRKRMLFKTC